jgi:hypothetical protein
VIEKLKKVIERFGIAIKNISILPKDMKRRGIKIIIKFPIFGGVKILFKTSNGFNNIYLIISGYVSPQPLYHTDARCSFRMFTSRAEFKFSTLKDGITKNITV